MLGVLMFYEAVFCRVNWTTSRRTCVSHDPGYVHDSPLTSENSAQQYNIATPARSGLFMTEHQRQFALFIAVIPGGISTETGEPMTGHQNSQNGATISFPQLLAHSRVRCPIYALEANCSMIN